MSAGKFACTSCERQYTWKPEIAGKRVKCKCGNVMTVASVAPGDETDDGLYDMAPADEPAKPAYVPRPVMLDPNAPQQTLPRADAPKVIGYRSGPTQRERERASSDVLLDKNRDIVVPIAMILLGVVAYMLYFSTAYSLAPQALLVFGSVVSVLTVVKAGVLFGFALVIAGPLGVSFGGIGTTILKFVAIVMFSDSVTAWVDYGVMKAAGGSGFGMGMLSWPIAALVYWLAMIYLFSMDPGDSWLVVILIAVMGIILRWVLLFAVLMIFSGMSGVGTGLPVAPGGGGGGGGGSAITQAVQQMKDAGELQDAMTFIEGGRQEALKVHVEAFKSAGARNVWFQVERDVEGKPVPRVLVIEMPRRKSERESILLLLPNYYKTLGEDPDDDASADDGEPYLILPIR